MQLVFAMPVKKKITMNVKILPRRAFVTHNIVKAVVAESQDTNLKSKTSVSAAIRSHDKDNSTGKPYLKKETLSRTKTLS